MSTRAHGRGLKILSGSQAGLRIIDGGPDAVASAVASAVAGTAASDHPALDAAEVRKPASVAAVPVLSETWDEVIPPLARNGLVHEPDAMLLERAVGHLAAYRDAAAELALVGPTVPGRDGGAVKNPADAVMRAQSLALQGIERELGLTFVSRSRMPARGARGASPAAVEDNPFMPGSEAR